MHHVKGFVLRKIIGEHILVGEGLSQVDFNKLITLNDSAAYLWESTVGREFTQDDLVELLLERYEVSRQQAAGDVAKLLASLKETGAVED